MPSATRARASVSRLRMFRSMRRRRISRNVFWLATEVALALRLLLAPPRGPRSCCRRRGGRRGRRSPCPGSAIAAGRRRERPRRGGRRRRRLLSRPARARARHEGHPELVRTAVEERSSCGVRLFAVFSCRTSSSAMIERARVELRRRGRPARRGIAGQEDVRLGAEGLIRPRRSAGNGGRSSSPSAPSASSAVSERVGGAARPPAAARARSAGGRRGRRSRLGGGLGLPRSSLCREVPPVADSKGFLVVAHLPAGERAPPPCTPPRRPCGSRGRAATARIAGRSGMLAQVPAGPLPVTGSGLRGHRDRWRPTPAGRPWRAVTDPSRSVRSSVAPARR